MCAYQCIETTLGSVIHTFPNTLLHVPQPLLSLSPPPTPPPPARLPPPPSLPHLPPTPLSLASQLQRPCKDWWPRSRRCLIVLYFIGADKEVLQAEIVAAGAVPPVVKLCSSSDAALQAEAADLLKVRSPAFVTLLCHVMSCHVMSCHV